MKVLWEHPGPALPCDRCGSTWYLSHGVRYSRASLEEEVAKARKVGWTVEPSFSLCPAHPEIDRPWWDTKRGKEWIVAHGQITIEELRALTAGRAPWQQ